MKLKTIQIFPEGSDGWGTEEMKFGDHITQLFGANGCGKTPMIQSIVFCLGFPSIFRSEIYNHCSHVVLSLEINKQLFHIKRIYSRDVDIEVTGSNNIKERFFNEKEYSNFMFEYLNMPILNLVGKGNKVAQPYLATLIPLLYAEQDSGYTAIYLSPSSFIKDQFSEMMRLIFDISSKNPFDAKKGKIIAKQRLEKFDNFINSKSKELELLKEIISSYSMSSDELNEEIRRLELELDSIKGEGATRSDSMISLDRLIANNNQKLRQLESDLRDIKKQKDSISIITKEINSEINALSLNEEARRVFLSFNEVCSSSKCQLFSGSSDAYAKNLLYLKDQLKDLERNYILGEKDEDRLKSEASILIDIIKNAVDERNQLIDKTDIESIVIVVSEMKDEIFRLQSQLSEIKNIEKLGKDYVSLLSKRSQALEKYESFSSSSSSSPKLLKLRADLRAVFLSWMERLSILNVSRDITFQNDFMPVLGVETIKQLGGSTKVRAILAFHAALFELAAKKEIEFNILILDTPKQHEIHDDDLDVYFKALKNICREHGIQVIFSTTGYKYEVDDFDTTWKPQYQCGKQLMFMKCNS